jgi:hypothetical protein
VAEEQVTAPDQHKPTNLRLARIGGVLSIIAILSMLFGNHDGIIAGDGSAWVEDVYVLLTAGVIAALLIGDAVLRRRGLRP